MSETSEGLNKADTRQEHERGNDKADKSRIVSYKDLIEEEQRLLMQVKRNKARVIDDYNLVKAKLQPANHALRVMSKLAGTNARPGMVSQGADIVVDLLSKKYLFRRSNWLVTLAGTYIVRGLSHLLLNKSRWKKERSIAMSYNGVE